MSSLTYFVDDVSNGLKTFGSDMRTYFGDFDLGTVAVIALVFLLAVLAYDVIVYLLFHTGTSRSYNSLTSLLASKAWDYRNEIDINPADYISARSLAVINPVIYAIQSAIEKYE
ncbi:uncharacterized protein LOC122242484 [Penaeus japonicus]|uniref:uncharacterized protein LOC122242484 n=1 Tax=Penaeus japonicus TaxID=27405 RepID=UPI001C71689B|nr:uncharacterized protein LOC122242484 [Penaeus japonicus]